MTDQPGVTPSSRSSGTGAPTAVHQVQDFSNAVHGLAAGMGRADLAAMLVEESARWREPHTTVVVVGEIKRGKTSLINSLLGRPGLLPVDADVATNVYLAVHGAEQPSVVVHLDGERPELVIDLADIPLYASNAGNPGNHRCVRAVEVGVDHPLLRQGLTVVDTPGVNGPYAGHTEVTLAALGLADALLFVTDASKPLTSTELAFLRRATERVDTLLLALARIDLFESWPGVLEDDRRLLATHAPAFKDAPVLPVSSRLSDAAADAAARGKETLAARARAASGFDAFEATLRARVTGRAAALRLLNMVRVGLGVLDHLEEEQVARIRAADGDAGAVAELTRRTGELKSLGEAAAGWRVALDRGFTDLRFDLDDLTRSRISDLEDRCRIDVADRPDAELAERVAAELQSGVETLWVEASLLMRERTAAIAEAVAGLLTDEGLGCEMADLTVPDGVVRRLDLRRRDDAPADLGAQVGKLLPAVTTPLMLQGAAGTFLGLAGGPVLGVGLLLGAMSVGSRMRMEKQAQARKEATEHLGVALRSVREAMSTQIPRALTAVRRELEDTVTARIQQRRAQLDTSIRELEALARQQEATRRQAGAAAAEARAAGAQLRTRGDALRAHLRGLGAPAADGSPA